MSEGEGVDVRRVGARRMTSAAAGALVTSAVIAAWADSGSRTKRIAATLARELANANSGDRVDSSMRIAARFGVSNTTAVNARYLLMGQKIIRKTGRHYYVADQLKDCRVLLRRSGTG